MGFQPLGPRLLVLMDQAGETQTKSGLFIPAQAQEKPQVGEVIAVGEKVERIKVGDRVVLGKYTGSSLTLDGTSYLVLNSEDVLGVIS